MARFNFVPILVTLGLVGVGGAAYYFATKKEGGGEPGGIDFGGIMDAIKGLFDNLLPKPDGGGDGGGDGNGGGDGGGDGGTDGGGDGGGGGGTTGGGTGTTKITVNKTTYTKGESIKCSATGLKAGELTYFYLTIGGKQVSKSIDKKADSSGKVSNSTAANTVGSGHVHVKGKTSGKTAEVGIKIVATSTGGGGTTPPPPKPTGGSVVFGAAGDWGSGRNSNWKKVTAVMKSQKIQTMLGLGDYSYTSTGAWQPVVDDLKRAGIVSKGAEGNHDSSSYAKTFTNQSSMLYTFNQGPACVIILNTESSASSNAAFAQKVLAATKQPWKILMMHKPLYTNSSDHGPETGLANALKPIINKYGVQLVLMAHNHNFQRMVISGYSKTVFVVSGTGGESHYSLKASQSGTKYMNNSDFGFTKISISGSTLKGQFINTSGSVKHSWTQTLGANANLAYVYPTMRAYPVYPLLEEPIGMRISI